MSDESTRNTPHPDDDEQNIQGTPNSGSTDADTASGGSPDSGSGTGDDGSGEDPDDVDPETGTNGEGQPIDNPSGG